MWSESLRYRKQYNIIGKPDFVFLRAKVAIFVDGDFWHGHNWAIRGLPSLEAELATYSEFWRKKILGNIERDKRVSKRLKQEGWLVLRFWESDISTNPFTVVDKIKRTVKRREKVFSNRNQDGARQ